MTNPQHEALVEAVARAICEAHFRDEGFGSPQLSRMVEDYWVNFRVHAIAALSATAAATQETAACAGCEGRPAPENNPCAVCGATAATPSGEEVRLRAALKEIADGTLIALECGDTWPSPLGAKTSQNLARAALEPQGKDV